MVGEITWITSGTLKGNPIYNYGVGSGGCETTCGNKQNWKLGVSGKVPKRTTIKVKPYTHNFIVSLSVQDTEGGACVGSWKDSASEQKHKIEVKVTIYGKDGGTSENTYLVIGGSSVLIPISGYGRYKFVIKTDEWGEECNKPKNTSTKYIVVSPPDVTDNDGDNDNDDDGNGDTGLIDTYKYPLAMLIGAGVIVAISAFMDRN